MEQCRTNQKQSETCFKILNFEKKLERFIPHRCDAVFIPNSYKVWNANKSKLKNNIG